MPVSLTEKHHLFLWNCLVIVLLYYGYMHRYRLSVIVVFFFSSGSAPTSKSVSQPDVFPSTTVPEHQTTPTSSVTATLSKEPTRIKETGTCKCISEEGLLHVYSIIYNIHFYAEENCTFSVVSCTCTM